MDRAWLLLETKENQVAQLKSSGVSQLLARCLVHRGLNQEAEVRRFLKLEDFEVPDPFLMPDLEVAVDRIVNAVNTGERICIYGDYDADGVSSITILLQAIRALGGRVFYYIPDRFFEGVGLNCERLTKLVEEGVSLVITVDTGSRAFEEMAYAAEIGLDVIITDHHTPTEERPNALAVLNPKMHGSFYPFHGLCGAGVALKLAQGLDKRVPGKIKLNECLKIAAIATVADMVPLQDENRWIVWQGLKQMDLEEKGPIRSLLKKVGVKGPVQSLDISFRVAPRINAPGRLGDPDVAIALLDDPSSKEITRLIDIMEGMNTVRQMIEKDLTDRLEAQVQSIMAKDLPHFVLLAGRNWHRGILGIMACKMLRRLERPVCILSYGQEEAHGSIRALPGVDLIRALNHLSPLLSSFGGHPEAAGISLPITNIPQFKVRMNELLSKQVAPILQSEKPFVDAIIDWSHIGDEMFRSVCQLAPFGIGNPAPIFLTKNLILENDPLIKGPWVHLEVSDGEYTHRCSHYAPSGLNFPLERFDSVDLLFSLMPYRDGFQIQVLEIKHSED